MFAMQGFHCGADHSPKFRATLSLFLSSSETTRSCAMHDSYMPVAQSFYSIYCFGANRCLSPAIRNRHKDLKCYMLNRLATLLQGRHIQRSKRVADIGLL